MSKAYDRVFLENMLIKFDFPLCWVSLVTEIVRTTTYKIKVNDAWTDEVVPTRGLGQGDPLSPYLFIVCAEWLSRAIEVRREQGLIKGISIAQGAPRITHLLFADDSMIFLRANRREIVELKSVLGEYERISGQKINSEKSDVVYSPNAEEDIRNYINDQMGVQGTERHTRYLGLPLVVGLNKKEMCRVIEEKIQKRITDWKYRMLSFAGKEVLVKSVLQALPIFNMQCYKLPKYLCGYLLSTAVRFLWSGDENLKSIHWVRKETMLKSKTVGGLGIRDPEVFNSVLLMKQLWRILKFPDLLMSRVLKARYFKNSGVLS
ncbi:hypothetical protein QQ045_011747 [Rhodiola kirilowii]